MKKIVSIILAALMLCALCAPAFAEDEPTEIKPEESGDSIAISDAGNYIIKGDNSVESINVGFPYMTDVTLTIPKGVTVTITNVFNNYGTINVYGTLIISDSAGDTNNHGTINVFSCSCGKLEGTINGSGNINTYNEHSFSNDKCTYCGTYKCELTGNHNYNSGVCSVCGTKGCEIGQLKHNWVNGVCSVCNTPCEHKWDAATGKCTVCELVCAHGGDKCDICGKKLVNLNAGSALSEGNMIIICSVATLVIGLCGGFIIGTKKKKKS